MPSRQAAQMWQVPKTCEADSLSHSEQLFYVSKLRCLCVSEMQAAHMKKASCIKKPCHPLNSCSPWAGFTNKVVSLGLGLAEFKLTLCRGKYRQEVSKSGCQPEWISWTKWPRFQHSTEGKHRWKISRRIHTHMPLHIPRSTFRRGAPLESKELWSEEDR